MAHARVIENYEPDDYGIAAAPIAASRNGTTHNGRIPPHDLDAERAVISACLYADTETVAQVAHLEPADFYSTRHQTIWTAVLDLHAQGVAPDPHLLGVERELAFELGGNQLAYRSNVGTYAQVITTHAWRRKVIGLAASLADAAYLTDEIDIAGMAEKVAAARGTTTQETSIVTDMQAVLDGGADVILPNLAPRDDRATCLLYSPGINWLDGEPGRGKSMLAMWWAHRELADGRPVVYIQYEGEGNKHQLGARLAQMGLTDATNLHYVHRSGPWTPAELAELRSLLAEAKPSLVVVDSVASAMQSEGLDPESNRDVEQWKAAIPSWVVAAGAAFLAVDHLPKNPEARGRYSIGAQRKLGIADVSYRLTMHQDAGQGRTGFGRLEVMKDREGALGAFQDGRTIAEVSIASEVRGDSYDLRVALLPPSSVTGSAAHGPTWYMERVSGELEAHGPLGKVELRTRVGKRKDQVDLAIERLLDAGAIEPVDVPGRAKPYKSVWPWRAPAPPPTTSFYEADDDI